MINKFFKNANKKQAISWALYDFANSAYSLLIVSFIFPIFFKEVIAQGSAGDFFWGLAVSISVLLAGISLPIIGAAADYDGKRKKRFTTYAALSMIGTAALYFTGPNTLILALFIFITTNFCFTIAQTFYDSFITQVSTKETTGRISGLGWGLGYLGGIISMLLLRPLYSGGYTPGLENLYKLTFPLTAIFFLIFAIPSFINIKENKKVREKRNFIDMTRVGITRVRRTLKDLKKNKRIMWFLIGFYILNDALVTLFAFVSIYANNTLGMTLAEIGIILLVIQIIGFPAAIFFGWVSDKKSPKKILLLTIIIWTLIVFGLTIATTKTMFYAIGIATGLVVGGSQAIARSWFGQIIPKEKRCEYFGFNGFATKIAATTGPIIFGLISLASGNQRIAMAALIPFFIISFIIFARIKE